jgi:hypothetical protein
MVGASWRQVVSVFLLPPWHVYQHSEDPLTSLVLKTSHLLLLNLVPRKTRHARLLPPPRPVVLQVQVVLVQEQVSDMQQLVRNRLSSSDLPVVQRRRRTLALKVKTILANQIANHSAPALVLVLSQVLVRLIGRKN